MADGERPSKKPSERSSTTERSPAPRCSSCSATRHTTRQAGAAHLLKKTQASSLEIAFEIGYEDQAHFARVFRRVAGTIILGGLRRIGPARSPSIPEAGEQDAEPAILGAYRTWEENSHRPFALLPPDRVPFHGTTVDHILVSPASNPSLKISLAASSHAGSLNAPIRVFHAELLFRR